MKYNEMEWNGMDYNNVPFFGFEKIIIEWSEAE
jgi:hypothetical protein